MPLTPPGLMGLMSPLVTAAGYLGTMSQPMVLGLSNAITSYLLTLQVKTTDVGTFGVGVGTGKVIITPPQLIGPLLGAATANGIKGTYAPPLMTAIGNAVASFIASFALVTSQHPTVAVGSGIGQLLIVGGPVPLQGQILAMLSANFTGQNFPSFAMAIAQGLTQGLATAQVVQVITGSPVLPPPVPSTGVGIGKLI